MEEKTYKESICWQCKKQGKCYKVEFTLNYARKEEGIDISFLYVTYCKGFEKKEANNAKKI